MARDRTAVPLAVLVSLLATAVAADGVGLGKRIKTRRDGAGARPADASAQVGPVEPPSADLLRGLTTPPTRPDLVGTALGGRLTSQSLEDAIPDFTKVRASLPRRSLAGAPVAAPVAMAAPGGGGTSPKIEAADSLEDLPWDAGVFISPVSGAPLSQSGGRIWPAGYMAAGSIVASPTYTLEHACNAGVTCHRGEVTIATYVNVPDHRGTYLIAIQMAESSTRAFPHDATAAIRFEDSAAPVSIPLQLNSDESAGVGVLTIPAGTTPFDLGRAGLNTYMEAATALITVHRPHSTRTVYFGGITITRL